MSKLLFCSQYKATIPYYFKMTNTKVYTIEELCYYIYNNIYSVDEAEMNEELSIWLKEELKLTDLSDRIYKLCQSGAKLKEFITTIFMSLDYYTNDELVEFLKIVDKIEEQPKIIRQKIKADNFLKYKNYASALSEYESIMQDMNKNEQTISFYGNVMHNIGVIYAAMLDYTNAAKAFHLAYQMNEKDESMIQYMYLLIISKKQNELERFMKDNMIHEDTINNMQKYIDQKYADAVEEDDYQSIQKAIQAKNQGLMTGYYMRLDSIISSWKKEYRYQTLR